MAISQGTQRGTCLKKFENSFGGGSFMVEQLNLLSFRIFSEP
jgi:hypothetical protein